MEDWFDAGINEALAACITALNQVVGSLALDWFSKDGIGITVTEDEDMAMAF